jgi:D-3-phosphoglycerate dehydrogenase
MKDGARPLVVLAVPPHPDARQLLAREVALVDCTDLSEAGVARAAKGAHGLMIRHKPPCTEALMAACPEVRVIGRYGAGLDTVDLAAATRLGVAIVHAPEANAPAVAEHTLMLMLACVKNLRGLERRTRAADWSHERYAGITELRGKTIGIVGVGRIGTGVARLAAAFGMRVVGYDPNVPEADLRARGVEPVRELGTLLATADCVTCHVPLNADTRGLFDKRTIGLMKPGAVFVNTSRGGLHDERALHEALVDGRLRAVGLDVWESEPPSIDNPLLAHDAVVCTPHVAGVSEEADRAIAMDVASDMLRVLRGERPRALGNPDVWGRAERRGA